MADRKAKRLTRLRVLDILERIGACIPAQDYVRKNERKGPRWLWDNARWDYQMWLLARLEYAGREITARNRALRDDVYKLDGWFGKEIQKFYYTSEFDQKYKEKLKIYRKKKKKLLDKRFSWEMIERALQVMGNKWLY